MGLLLRADEQRGWHVRHITRYILDTKHADISKGFGRVEPRVVDRSSVAVSQGGAVSLSWTSGLLKLDSHLLALHPSRQLDFREISRHIQIRQNTA